MRIDLRAAGVGAARRALGQSLNGKLTLGPPETDGGWTIVTVPVYEGNPAAILIETEPPPAGAAP